MSLFKKLESKIRATVGSSKDDTVPSQQQQQNVFSASSSSSFVTRKGSKLYLDDKEYRFASFNCPRLTSVDSSLYTHIDTFNTLKHFATPSVPAKLANLTYPFPLSLMFYRVARTYVLQINSVNVGSGHIVGCWGGNWQWNENAMLNYDAMLAEAAKAGVKLIIPIIGQDYGNEKTNWVGNIRDLIKMKKGIKSYEDTWNVDFWRDEDMVTSFERLVTELLTRVNTITGVRYADDPTILAWETGNELNENSYGSAGMKPAPGQWTVRIARHIKSIAPHALVMDGSFARNDKIESCWSKEVLQDPDAIDILSYHYYGTGDLKRLPKDIQFAHRHGKSFVMGEYGFFSSEKAYSEALNIIEKNKATGSLIWSLRAHSSKGGYEIHHEQDEFYSHHAPGWENPSHEFDKLDIHVIPAIYKSSFRINSREVPKTLPKPTGKVDNIWYDDSKKGLVWVGVAWAKSYQVWCEDQLIDSNAVDAVTEGSFVWKGAALPSPQGKRKWRVRPLGTDGSEGEWSDSIEI